MINTNLYKDWIRYLKDNNHYGYYIYTVGKITESNYYRQLLSASFDNCKIKANQILFLPENKREEFFFPRKDGSFTYINLLLGMKYIDVRVKKLNNCYKTSMNGTPFPLFISWEKLALMFIYEKFSKEYGEKVSNKVRKKIRENKKRREREEQLKREEKFRNDPSIGYHVYYDIPEVTATTAIVSNRDRGRHERNGDIEIRGQWYDRFNRANLRRENRWRMR